MQITSRFTLAIHTMLCIAYFEDKMKVTSDFIAKSTNANPVIIRRIIGQLKEAELVETHPGVGGNTIPKPLKDITLLDIFNAVDAMGPDFFGFHNNPNCLCPIGGNIHTVLDGHLQEIQDAMNDQMEKTNMKELFTQTEEFMH